jgi:hypothetical protein
MRTFLLDPRVFLVWMQGRLEEQRALLGPNAGFTAWSQSQDAKRSMAIDSSVGSSPGPVDEWNTLDDTPDLWRWLAGAPGAAPSGRDRREPSRILRWPVAAPDHVQVGAHEDQIALVEVAGRGIGHVEDVQRRANRPEGALEGGRGGRPRPEA